jgi:colanic acid biosynthesis glycosyl transferase WcaI
MTDARATRPRPGEIRAGIANGAPHLALYSLNYAPEPIGIPYYNAGMARWLVGRLRWSVVVRTGIPHYPGWRVPPSHAGRDMRAGRGDEVIDGVAVERVPHHVPSLPLSGAKRACLDASWLVATWWRSWSTRRRPQAVMMVAPPFLGGLLGLFLGWRWGVPVVYHVQDLQVDAALDLGMLPRRLGSLLSWCERLILRHADLVTTVSPGMAQRIRAKGAGGRRVRLFPNWVDPSGLELRGTAAEFRRQWGAGEGVVAMYSGSLGRKQGLEVLIEAVALIAEDCPVQVVIAGDGPERAGLEALVRARGLTRICFCDLVPADRLGDFLSAADLHVIPQRKAAAGSVMPSKLLNIMAVGRPVVVTADHGTDLARTVQAAGGGAVVEPESPLALARAIERLAYSRAEREDCGQAARRYVLARYGIDRVLGAFAQAVTAIVRRRRSTRAGRWR